MDLKLRDVCLSVCPYLHVCLSVRMEQLNSQWKNNHKICCLIIVRKPVVKTQVSLKSEKKNGYFTWRITQFHIVWLNFYLAWEMFQIEAAENITTHSLRSVTFFSKMVPWWNNVKKCGAARQATDDNMWNNMVQPDRPQMTICGTIWYSQTGHRWQYVKQYGTARKSTDDNMKKNMVQPNRPQMTICGTIWYSQTGHRWQYVEQYGTARQATDDSMWNNMVQLDRPQMTICGIIWYSQTGHTWQYVEEYDPPDRPQMTK